MSAKELQSLYGPAVWNKRSGDSPSDAVYIGRPSDWGNPYVIGRDGTRKQVIEKYRAWLLDQHDLVSEAQTKLRGKHLVCFCAPLACHGDVLLEIANSDFDPLV